MHHKYKEIEVWVGGELSIGTKVLIVYNSKTEKTQLAIAEDISSILLYWDSLYHYGWERITTAGVVVDCKANQTMGETRGAYKVIVRIPEGYC